MKLTYLVGRARGFSLIEVLVAVVVLSVGLLALSALQVALVRSSAESKSQTVGLARAQEQIETLRNIPDSSSYLAMTDGSSASAVVGGVTFTRSWAVERFVYRTDLGGFRDIGAGNETISATAVKALNANYDTNLEFKKVTVTSGWTDPTGVGRSVILSDVISSSNSTDSLSTTEEAAGGTRSPQTRIKNPANQTGTLPIAVGTDSLGNTQSVAATDPKPQTYGTSGKVATTFTVQTYASDADGFTLQKNFDTSVVSCRCTLASGSLATGTYSPSYWDGDEFTTPKLITGKAYAAKTSGVDQDDLCSTCCRDHHDKTGQTVLFDPFRPSTDYTSGNHNHYLRSGSRSSATFTLATGTNSYDEACRLVRVGGVYQVTTDPQLENVLTLNTTGTVSAPVLDTTVMTNYATFAKGYIDSAWTAMDTNDVEQSALDDYTKSPDGMNQTDPVALVMPVSGAGPEKQLATRALFFDWLSDDVKEKVACVGQTSDADCNADYPAYVSKSKYQVFPFLTINLTGLGEWSNSNTSAIFVYNQAVPTNRTTSYIRGRVQGLAAGSATASVISYRGPVGMTDQEPISYHDKGIAANGTTVLDARVPMTDTRGFTVTSSTSSSNNKFVVELKNPTNDANLKTAQLTLSSSEYSCSRGAGAAGTDPTDSSVLATSEHLCIGPDATLTVNLSLSNYNYILVTCPNGGYAPIDANDPDTLCEKNNGTTASPTSVVTRYYKVCSFAPTTAIGTIDTDIGTPARSNSAHPDTEYTPLTITATASTALSLRRFDLNLYPSGDTCP